MTLKFSTLTPTAALGQCPPRGHQGEGTPDSFHRLCGFKMFFLVSTGPTQARPFFQVMTDTFWNLPNLLGHSSPWGRGRGLVLPPGRVTPSFPEKGLGHGVPPPLHPRPHEGSKPFPLRLQEPGLEFGRPEVWPKMLREDWGAGPLGPPEDVAPSVTGSGEAQRRRFSPSPTKAHCPATPWVMPQITRHCYLLLL